jgi:hypothetical protein
MILRHVMASVGGLALLAGAAVPTLLAREGTDRKDKEARAAMSEGVVIAKPFSEVEPKVKEAVARAGLVELALIDWTSARESAGEARSTESSAPSRLAAKENRLCTYIVETPDCVRMSSIPPKHALMIPGRFILYERGDKTFLVHTLPHASLADRPAAEIPIEYREHALDLEKRLIRVSAFLDGKKVD